MCGLFGFIGSKKPNIAKIKILGLYNTKRGKDSCGYYYNGHIFRGVDKIKEFPDFIQNHIIADVSKPKSNVFIGHTRQASVGSSSIENCHPFNINGRYILAHNGTIENIWDLCSKYDVDDTDIHVDSKALGVLYDKVGPSILTEYRGYAALLIHDLKDPESLYVYHGGSKQFDYPTAPVLEERPLFYMETREGFYFSSLSEALDAIRDVEGQEPFKVELNKLIRVTGKEFNSNVFDVYRENNNVGVQKKTTVYYPANTCGTKNKNIGNDTKNTVVDLTRRLCNLPPIKVGQIKVDTPIKIEEETAPCRFYDLEKEGVKKYVWYWKGRHYDQDENLCNGMMFINSSGHVFSEASDGVYDYYFYRGILLNNNVAYERITDAMAEDSDFGKAIMSTKENFAKLMSKFSRYPITNIDYEANLIDNEFIRNCWYAEEKPAGAGITPVWSDRNYTFKAGNLIKVENAKKDSRDHILCDGGKITKYANSEYFDCPFVDDKKKETITEAKIISLPPIINAHFDNGEFMEKGDKHKEAIAKLMPYFYRKYDSISDIENKIPYQVYIAICKYQADLLACCTSPVTQDDIDTSYNQFIDAAVRDKSIFYDLMDGQFSDIKIYLEKALEEYPMADNPIQNEITTGDESLVDESFHIENEDDDEDELANQQAYASAFRDMQEPKSNIFHSIDRGEIDAAYYKEIAKRERERRDRKANQRNELCC